MKTVRAIYEDGVFKPTEAVDLPEHAQVEFEPVEIVDDSTEDDSERLSKFCGIIKNLPIEPMEYQRQMREEWD